MLVMELMMRDYFRLMVGRNRLDCYIQLWEPKTSRSGRPTSPSDASRRPLSRRGLTRKFVFPPSPETSSEQMRAVSRFSSSARRGVFCPATAASAMSCATCVDGLSASLDGQEPPAGANRNAANNSRGSSGCRSRAASTRNMAVSAAPRQCHHPCGGFWVRLPRRGQGPGGSMRLPCGSLRGAQSLGGSRVGPWRCTKLWARSLCAYKDMRRCPVKHFQDFPRIPKTLGRGGTIHSDKTSFNSALGSPQHTAHSPRHRLQIRSCTRAREQRSPRPGPIPSDWRWDSVSGLWNSRRHQGASACPQLPTACGLFGGPRRIQRSDWRNPVAHITEPNVWEIFVDRLMIAMIATNAMNDSHHLLRPARRPA